MTVAVILSGKGDEVVSTGADTPVREVVALLAERRIGAVPVVGGDGGVLGILSERDLIYRLASDGAAILDATASEVMTAPAITVTRDLTALGALALMTRRRIRHLPVIDQGQLVGLVSIGDIVKYRIDRIETEAAAMRDYIQSV